ncbi:hypothetical protein HSX10_07445 [Winogradskyella undariae]|uniref:hypothetical protein n=1 Tax=Winogradskyella undariae TaxID=1285465 RepID=UPI00156BD4F8|nr:hypothetical protein [Winogradskyella undariae]NRR91395.1 hypothetical protein [Winogradskyella undariae]|tara:strand:- start:980 stop:1363 length:384 start_codon:yes stop_codon:yes gene_type:complete
MKNIFLTLIAILSLVACSSDDDGEVAEMTNANLSYKLVYTTGVLPSYYVVRAGNTITYEDSFEFKEVGYDEDTRTVTVETDLNPVKIESNFYIEGGSEVNIKLISSEGNIIDEQTISEVNYTYIHNF